MPTAQRIRNAAHVATRLKTLLGHDQIAVRPHGPHLHIRLVEDNLETTIARLTEIGGSTFAVGFRNHSGRWEPLPGTGDLDEAIEMVFGCLEPYLQPYPL